MSATQVIQTELISYRINYKKSALPAVVVGAGALVLALLLSLASGIGDFLHAYLAAYLFWFGLTIGCLALTMLHHLTGGRWGECLRPLLETGIKGVPLLAILGLPLLIGMNYLYPWTQDEKYMGYVGFPFIYDRLVHQSHIWMYPSFFIIRYFIYFAILFGLRVLLLSKYRLRDEMAVQDPKHNSGSFYRLVSGPGIVLLGITVTLAMFDFAMSAQPGWFSTIYGMASLAGQGLSTFSFMVVTLLLIVTQWEKAHTDREGHHPTLLGKGDWHDLGNLMLAFTMLWGYVSLSQLLITYSGHLPQETIFYNFRSQNGWEYIGGALIALHFALPFFLLLMRDLKRDPKKLVLIALFILIIRQLDFYYQVHPSYALGLRDAEGKTFAQVTGALGWHTIQDILTVIGIGGLWIAFFSWNLKDRRVLPAPTQEDHHG